MADTKAPQKKTYFFSKEEKEKLQHILMTLGYLKTMADGLHLSLEKDIHMALKRINIGLANENVNRKIDYDLDKGEIYITDTPKPPVEAPKEEKTTSEKN